MPYGSGAANKAMKANKALLGERKKQKLSYATKTDKINQFTKKATPKQLQEIRDRIKEEEKREQKKFIFIVIIAIVILYFFATLIDWHWFFKNFK